MWCGEKAKGHKERNERGGGTVKGEAAGGAATTAATGEPGMHTGTGDVACAAALSPRAPSPSSPVAP